MAKKTMEKPAAASMTSTPIDEGLAALQGVMVPDIQQDEPGEDAARPVEDIEQEAEAKKEQIDRATEIEILLSDPKYLSEEAFYQIFKASINLTAHAIPNGPVEGLAITDAEEANARDASRSTRIIIGSMYPKLMEIGNSLLGHYFVAGSFFLMKAKAISAHVQLMKIREAEAARNRQQQRQTGHQRPAPKPQPGGPLGTVWEAEVADDD